MTNKLYHAASLEDIAKMFDMRADDVQARYKPAKTNRLRQELNVMFNTWKDAAEILRQTELSTSVKAKPIWDKNPYVGDMGIFEGYGEYDAEDHPAQDDVDKIMKDG